MVKEIIQIGDKRLSMESEPVNVNDIDKGKIQELAQNLIDTCKHYVDSAAGLSAVQLGELKRIFVVRRLDLEKGRVSQKDIQWEVMINPILEFTETEKSIEWEGCMSINSDAGRLFGPVERPKKAILKYLDLKGETHTLKTSNFFSHLIQHEVDHLDGKLFLRYIKNPKNIWKEEELDKYLDKYRAFPPIKD